MNIKYDQFIGIYENAFSAEYCNGAIKYFNDMDAAGFTHTHRGNPPISGTKYIITGWVEF